MTILEFLVAGIYVNVVLLLLFIPYGIVRILSTSDIITITKKMDSYPLDKGKTKWYKWLWFIVPYSKLYKIIELFLAEYRYFKNNKDKDYLDFMIDYKKHKKGEQ